MKRLILLCLILLFSPSYCWADETEYNPLSVVSAVDFSRYAGKWFEIARLPNRFQKNCAGETTATYTVLDETQLTVLNECRNGIGRIEQAQGTARVADKSGPNTKLKVRFAPAWLSWLPSIWGDYWIMDLGSDYSYAVIGTPDRKYLWILSRTPRMEESVYEKLKQHAAAAGFNVALLVRTN